MTIVSTVTIERYVGDGVQKEWPVGFPFFRLEHVRASVGAPGGPRTILAYGKDYTVTRAAAGAQGGILHHMLPSGQQLTIWLDQPFTQELDLRNNGLLEAEALEQAYDRLTLMAQQLKEEVGRSVKVSIESTTNPNQIMTDINAALAATQASASAAAGSSAASQTARQGSEAARAGSETARTGAEAAQAVAETAKSQTVSAAASAKADMESFVVRSKDEMLGIASGVPIGMEATFPLNSIPAGWLIEMGQTVTKLAYPELVKYLTGSSTAETAILPDMRGEFARGADLGRGVDAGRVVGSLQGDAIRNIIGSVAVGRRNGVQYTDGAFYDAGPGGAHALSADTDGYVARFDASRVVPTAAENRPRNIAKVWCIKAYHAPSTAKPVDMTAILAKLDAYAAVWNPNVGKTSLIASADAAWRQVAASVVTVVSGSFAVLSGYEDWCTDKTKAILTIPEDGWYALKSRVVMMAVGAATEVNAILRIYRAGSLLVSTAEVFYSAPGQVVTLSPDMVLQLKKNDLPQLHVFSGGASQYLNGGAFQLSATRIR